MAFVGIGKSVSRRFRRWPVRWRLTFVSASLTFAILLLFGGIVGNLAAERVRSDFDHDLEESASRLVTRTRIFENPLLAPKVKAPDLSGVAFPADSAARVVSASGEIVEEAPSSGIEFGAPQPGIANHGTYAVATAPVTGAEGEVVGYIQYARSTDAVTTTITKLWIFIVGGVLGGTVLAIFAGIALASRAMRPIAALTETAREVASTQDPSQRIPEPTTEDEVGELTRTLQEMLTALDTARNEREATLRKQRQFVADASHELRTPLTSVLANLELLEAQLGAGGDSEERDTVDSAVRSSQRMSRLVSDLLFLARSDAGQHRVRSDCDLAEIATSAAREVAPKLGDRVLDTRGCRHAPVRGNQDDLHRLILNLLDNAARYSPPGAEIAVETGVEGELAIVEVADSGPGIPANMRERVFERFVRSGGGSDTSTMDGTGLGLAMVKAIAEDHGGTALAGTSAELGGASIRVTLPLGDRALLELEAGQVLPEGGVEDDLVEVDRARDEGRDG
jgi:two-component system OmpR family sensor kinase